MNPYLARLNIFPIKSLDPISLTEARLQSTGSLEFDRRFALFDLQGRHMNGKRSAKLQQVRAHFAADLSSATLSLPDGASREFRLPAQGASLAGWIGNFLGESLVLSENSAIGFPDDVDNPGPTLISTATLQRVADWFGLSLEESRSRFRTNLEIDGVEPFWEDRLASASGAAVRLRVGGAELLATNPCCRCAVPTRDSKTGAPTKQFVHRFIAERQASLPRWAPASLFAETPYRLAINTQVAPNSGDQLLKVGDSIEIIEVN